MPEMLRPDVFFREIEVGPEPIQAAGTSAAAFIGEATKGEIGKPTFVSSFHRYKQLFGTDYSVGWMTRAVERFFEMGASRCWVVRTNHYTDITDPDAYTAVSADLIVQSNEATPTNLLTFTAKTPGTWANDYDIVIENGSLIGGVAQFDLRVLDEDGDTVEQFTDLSMDSTSDLYVETVINTGVMLPHRRVARPSDYIIVEVMGSPAANIGPTEGTYDLNANTSGTNGDTLVDQDYIGSSAGGTGLYALDNVVEMLNIVIPGVTSTAVHNSAINYCKTNVNRGGPYGWDFYVADLPFGLSPQLAMEHLRDNLNTNSWEEIIYPWVKVTETVGWEPAAPFMAGLIALADKEFGPWRAPAGERWPIPITDVAYDVTNSDQEILNPYGINAIRHRPFRGKVNWGCRTARTGTKWQYISTRRFFNFIKKTLYDGMGWTIFEMNGPDLWERVESTEESFMTYIWNLGAFGGFSKEESFFAECNRELNPDENIERGLLRSRIGINPVEPVEFHLIDLENHTSLPVKGG